MIVDVDRRGKHGKQPKIDHQIGKDIQEFLAKIPKYSSHYGREKDDHSLLTLAPNLTKHKLFTEFTKGKEY